MTSQFAWMTDTYRGYALGHHEPSSRWYFQAPGAGDHSYRGYESDTDCMDAIDTHKAENLPA